MNMNFNTNKTPIKVIKEEAFGGTYFRDIYSNGKSKWYRKSWKELDKWKYVGKKCYCLDYHNISINKYGVKCGTSLRFWKNKDWINSIYPYGWFQWYFIYSLGRRSLKDERQITECNVIVSRFKGKQVKMIKDINGRFDDILFHLRLDKFYCIEAMN